MSGVRLTRAYLPGMLARNWGRVVFISSESGVQIPEEMIHYGVTKAAETGSKTNGIAQLTRATGVTIKCRASRTDCLRRSDRLRRAIGGKGKAINHGIREGIFFAASDRPPYCSALPAWMKWRVLVVFICSPLASATNGAALRVDGGVVARHVKSGAPVSEPARC